MNPRPWRLAIALLTVSLPSAGFAAAVREAAPVTDVHVHLAAVPDGKNGCWIAPKMMRGPLFRFLAWQQGLPLDYPERANEIYLQRLVAALRQAKTVRRAIVLGLDGIYDSRGELDRDRASFLVSNDYVLAAARRFPDVLLAGVSINPRRLDALQEVERCARAGAVLVKVLPNAQRFDPADPALVPFYRALVKHRLALLCHVGYEYALAGHEQSFGDPARLKLPLDLGVTVIAAHGMTNGLFFREPHLKTFRAFVQKYPDFYWDASALSLPNRVGMLWRLREKPELAARMLFGTDYPIPAFAYPVLLAGEWKAWREIRRIENPFDRHYRLLETFGLSPGRLVFPGPGGRPVVRAASSSPAGRSRAGQFDLAGSVQRLAQAHPGQTGLYVLDKGEESLLARGWLADHARKTIDVQYFIWSTDNIGILASEALLRAADRGVRVRVLVDDLAIQAAPRDLLALAAHPRIDIRIYNPKISVGVPLRRRLWNFATGLKAANQRMHNKTMISDGVVAVTGGRNMANEYYDFGHALTFRDRDVLLLGAAVRQARVSFDSFWGHALAVPVERLLAGPLKALPPERIQAVYQGLKEYAADPIHFEPEVRQALDSIPQRFDGLVRRMTWARADFISDHPGKNDRPADWEGGGRTTEALLQRLRGARRRVTIQSPYLVLTDFGLGLLKELTARGVEVRILTNSLASTDNLPAFSGYARIRPALLQAGVQVREFRPDAAVARRLLDRFPRAGRTPPRFSLHAKTLVVDGEHLFIGTFNLDPRSAHLNTEAGVFVRSPALARRVEADIESESGAENSWDAGEAPDRFAARSKRWFVAFLKRLPLQRLL